MLGRQTGGLLVLLSNRDPVIFRGHVILAVFRAVRPHFCLVQTPVFSEIFVVISGSRVRREEIWDSGKPEPDPTILRKPQQGCRTVTVSSERIVGFDIIRPVV